MAQVIVFDDKDIESIKALKTYAEGHAYSMDDMLDLLSKSIETPGDIEDFTRYILDYKVVFTIDWQPFGNTRHMSISKRDKTEPNYYVVTYFMQLLGFEWDIKTCYTYMEDGYAVNILEPIDKEKFEQYKKDKNEKV
jgi:hypothetical protein